MSIQAAEIQTMVDFPLENFWEVGTRTDIIQEMQHGGL